ncbi:zinc-dependent alcohol dehydrogenase [Spiribacter onubensis]|uniref:Zinc-binding alcohol dehydrogenase n=1 Tax=Spiribacter onubensis TaxID=3122420 RepID=A0ABV3S7I0_9GAMM
MSHRNAQAFWITAPGRGEHRSEPLGQPGPGELVVRTIYSGISRGTEALVWHGQVPGSETRRMRAPFQAGDFPAPVKYGYVNVGLVEQGPPGWPGTAVFCLYPHQTRYIVPVDGVEPLPADLPAERAVLAANAETALNACWDAMPQAGERISVIGAGVVGMLTAALCSAIPGSEVELVDINPARRETASRLGIDFAHPDEARTANDRIIHASASEDGLRLALEVAANEATIIELSWFGDRAISLPIGEAFHSRRLTLRSSQVGQIPPLMQARWDHRRRLRKALQLLAAHPEWAVLIDGETPFEQLPQAMDAIISGAGLCHRIRYEE